LQTAATELRKTLSCDIFCRVIDNLGDAGMCWRLARQLSQEFDWKVRLFIDDPGPLALLAPDQNIVDVTAWPEDLADPSPANVVIEAFACNLPASYIRAMAAQVKPPIWLNLEYLSAEDWVAGCHALPSPRAGLRKYFFFPGFVPGTGGLLREKNLAVSPAPTFSGPLEISLFCYDNPQLPALLSAWRDGEHPIVCHVCDGAPRQQVERWLGTALPAERGHLRLVALPFLPQTGYDILLNRCHLNFVRGEDSFVRAQWAERPFVWQAYPQADGAHLDKLDAFLNLYTDNAATRAFFRAWNGVGHLDWPAFLNALPALTEMAPGWKNKISIQGDLATNLVQFCAAQL